jgi:hypothetical protein
MHRVHLQCPRAPRADLMVAGRRGTTNLVTFTTRSVQGQPKKDKSSVPREQVTGTFGFVPVTLSSLENVVANTPVSCHAAAARSSTLPRYACSNRVALLAVATPSNAGLLLILTPILILFLCHQSTGYRTEDLLGQSSHQYLRHSAPSTSEDS